MKQFLMSYIILPTKADVQYKYMYIHTNFIIVWPCRSTYCKYNVVKITQ